MKPKVLIVNGSYRKGGVTDQVIAEIEALLQKENISYEVLLLRETDIEFCLNCRVCTQAEGAAPQECVQDDAMHRVVEKIESAEAYILASPVNFYTVTALFKRFIERLIVYTYWPWGTHAPRFRKESTTKCAVLVSSSAAPSLIGRYMSGSMKLLRKASRVIGARVVGTLFLGGVAMQEHYKLNSTQKRKARELGRRLIGNI